MSEEEVTEKWLEKSPRQNTQASQANDESLHFTLCNGKSVTDVSRAMQWPGLHLEKSFFVIL